MKKYKNKYGFICLVIIIISFIIDINLLPGFFERSGALLIIVAVIIWKTDFDNFKINDKNLNDVKNDTLNLWKKLSESLEESSKNSPPYFKGDFKFKEFFLDKCEQADINKIVIEQLEENKNLLGDSLNRTVENQQFFISLLSTNNMFLRDVIELQNVSEDIKSKFVEIEVNIAVLGTLIWGFGSYIFSGWMLIFSLIG